MSAKEFPAAPAGLHFVGVGGIGMSGLAQLFAWLGYAVSGSDRALEAPENAQLFAQLKAQGVKLFPQDGSYVRGGSPALLVYSTAIEEDNPDFAAGATLPRWHRSETIAAALALMAGKTSIAVTGSCGKTTVSAWLADALAAAGAPPTALLGGMAKAFKDGDRPGNFAPGAADLFVFEADESDKSLLNFSPDFSLILNIGTDHYSKEELVAVFEQFLRNTRKGAVVEFSTLAMLAPESHSHLEVSTFSLDSSAEADYVLSRYRVVDGAAWATVRGPDGELDLKLPAPGVHNAANAMAVLAAARRFVPDVARLAGGVEGFLGTARRFDFVGKTAAGAVVYDDYAHNVEKIASCLKAAAEIRPGRTFAVFQPHGFAPLRFMRGELLNALSDALGPVDQFIFLPVYYAGGTSSFTPTSTEVCAEYAARRPGSFLCFDTRAEAAAHLLASAGAGDLVVIMGARDNSLPLWAQSFVR